MMPPVLVKGSSIQRCLFWQDSWWQFDLLTSEVWMGSFFRWRSLQNAKEILETLATPGASATNGAI